MIMNLQPILAVGRPRLSRVFVIAEADAEEPSRSGRGQGDDSDPALVGKRVLIVEDEFFVAVQIETAVQSFGCETIGPFTRLDLAIQASRREQFHIAVLDINLNQTLVYPLADELLIRSIPFVFLTGYAHADLPESYRSLPRIQKPFDPRAVKHALIRALTKPN
jgi:CheY-like chemotaxis protein